MTNLSISQPGVRETYVVGAGFRRRERFGGLAEALAEAVSRLLERCWLKPAATNREV